MYIHSINIKTIKNWNMKRVPKRTEWRIDEKIHNVREKEAFFRNNLVKIIQFQKCVCHPNSSKNCKSINQNPQSANWSFEFLKIDVRKSPKLFSKIKFGNYELNDVLRSNDNSGVKFTNLKQLSLGLQADCTSCKNRKQRFQTFRPSSMIHQDERDHFTSSITIVHCELSLVPP